jgi:hypothetical protein
MLEIDGYILVYDMFHVKFRVTFQYNGTSSRKSGVSFVSLVNLLFYLTSKSTLSIISTYDYEDKYVF